MKETLNDGVFAVPGGLLWLERSRSVVAADVHFGYEEVIGGALPLWSTPECVATLCNAARELRAEEIVLLGDVIHGAAMSSGAAELVSGGLRRLRRQARLVLIAGNHEGKSRGAAVLGETHEEIERQGWILSHGDRPALRARVIIGHLHPSLHLGSNQSAPAFLSAQRLIVVPALTPYSHGLDVRSDACLAALASWGIACADVEVVASSASRLFRFGSLASLRSGAASARGSNQGRFRRKFLRPDR